MTKPNVNENSLNVRVKSESDTRVAAAIRYLQSGYALPQDAVKIALGCLFTPCQKALEGASVEEIESEIRFSRMQFESYINLARVFCKAPAAEFFKNVRFEEGTDITAVEGASQPSVGTGNGPLPMHHEADDAASFVAEGNGSAPEQDDEFDECDLLYLDDEVL